MNDAAMAMMKKKNDKFAQKKYSVCGAETNNFSNSI